MANKSRKPLNDPPGTIDEAAATIARERNSAFIRTRVVTLPHFKFDNRRDGPNKFRDSSPLYLRIDGPSYPGRPIEGSKMDPATLVNVTDMETGELGMIILDTVLGRLFEEEYPDDSYVGCGFEIIRQPWHETDSGNGYYRYTLFEVAVPDELKPANGNPQKAPGKAKGRRQAPAAVAEEAAE